MSESVMQSFKWGLIFWGGGGGRPCKKIKREFRTVARDWIISSSVFWSLCETNAPPVHITVKKVSHIHLMWIWLESTGSAFCGFRNLSHLVSKKLSNSCRMYDKAIILKRADRGTTSIIMSRENKINEGLALLNERNNYQPLTQPVVENTTRKAK